MEKANKVKTLALIVLVGFLGIIIFNFFMGFFFKDYYIYNTFFFNPEFSLSPENIFSDFTGVLPKIKGLQPYAPPADWQNYFPLSFILILPFAYLKNKFVAYFIFVSIFVSVFVYFNYKFLNCLTLNKFENIKNIFIISCLSFPFLFIVLRGNLDMLIMLFFIATIYFLNKKNYRWSSVFLAVVNSLKLFSFLFPIIFLCKKQYKEFFINIGLTFLLIIGGFLFFKGNILYQISILLESWIHAAQGYIYANNNNYGMVYQSSLFMLLKLIFCKNYSSSALSTFQLAKFYNLFVLIFTLATIISLFKERFLWKQITLLTLYMILIPSISFDYKLIFLYAPIWLFVNSEEKSRFDLIYTILLGLLLIPKSIIFNNSNFFDGSIFSLSLIINPVIMLGIMLLIIYEQIKYKKEAVEDK